MPGKVRVIPANTNEPIKHVVIYARVSSNTMDQLESLKAQISGLTKFVSGHNNWKLVDIHIDIASAKKDSSRPAFHQMIEECKAGLTDIVVVKSISRLGSDTVEVLDAINTLRESQVRIIFKQEELDTLTVGSSLLISTIEACTQAENETRSDNIKWGIKQRASNGSLGFYRRKCYGYDKDEKGDLVINKEQAEVVKLAEALQEIKHHNEYMLELKKKQKENVPVMENRLLAVHTSNGYNYKSTSMIMLKGDWLRNCGFEPGSKVNTVCEVDGKLLVSINK